MSVLSNCVLIYIYLYLYVAACHERTHYTSNHFLIKYKLNNQGAEPILTDISYFRKCQRDRERVDVRSAS